MKIKIIEVKRGIDVNFSSKVLKKNWDKSCKIKDSFNDFDSNSFFYVAEKENVVIGYLYAYIASKSGILTYHSSAVLETLIVDPNYQNQGIATLLLEVFLDVCHNHNIKIIKTEMFYQNEFMKKLYWKLNMKKYCYHMRLNQEEEFA